jgi:hypothetical protein
VQAQLNFEPGTLDFELGNQWKVNQTSGLALFAKQRVPHAGNVVQVHGLPPFQFSHL